MQRPQRSVVGLAALVLLANGAFAQVGANAWGLNSSGQCNVPALPAGLSYGDLDGGKGHSLARRSDGSVVAWGSNSDGQCNVPGLPVGLTYTQVSAGLNHSVAVVSDGSLRLWGSNGNWQLDMPPAPAGLHYLQASAGHMTTVALRSDGNAIVCGFLTTGFTVPALPAGLVYTKVEAGYAVCVALRSDGQLIGWGFNYSGEINIPAPPSGLTYLDAACGFDHVLSLRSDGAVIATGSNAYGQCNVPPLPTGKTYVAVACGWRYSVALRSDGTVLVWGFNGYGQANVVAPPTGAEYLEIASGYDHVLARYAPYACAAPTTYCTAKMNSLGCMPAIGFTGVLSLSGPNDFVVTASNVRNVRTGLLFWGRAPGALPFQGGLMCIAGPRIRTGLQESGGNTGVEDCSGTFAVALTNEYLFDHSVVEGEELYAQYWSRDPNSAPYFTSLSDALHMRLCP
jgi:hypothetical protein